MATKKRTRNYYYVLVFTSTGTKFVTLVKRRTAEWDENEKPKSLGRYDAEEIARGLTINGNMAVVVHTPYELDNHIYDYAHFKCEFKTKEEV